MAIFLTFLLAATGGTVLEPQTEAAFPHHLAVGGEQVSLTGANYRQVSGVVVYAIAHYGAPEAAPKELDPAKARWHWIEAAAGKAFVLKGTRSVPARGIRYSWSSSLKRGGYTGPNLEGFVEAFTKDFERDSTLVLSATAGGVLRAEQDGELLGEWDDPALVQAVWKVSLGRDSEVRQPEKLVTRDHLDLPPLAQDRTAAPAAPSAG